MWGTKVAEEQSPTTLTFLGSRDLGGATAVWLVIGLFEDKGFAFVAVFFDGDAGATGGPQRDASLPKVLLPLPDILGGFLLPLSSRGWAYRQGKGTSTTCKKKSAKSEIEVIPE